MSVFSNMIKQLLGDPQLVLLLLVVVASTLGLMFFADMLAPAIAAVIIAFLLDGPVTRLERAGMTHWVATTIVFLAFLFAAIITLLIVVPPLVNQIAAVIENSPAILSGLRDGLLSLQQRFPDLLTLQQVDDFYGRITNEVANFGPQILQYSLTGLTSALTIIVYFVLVPMMVFFFLKDKRQILGWASGFLPKDKPLVDRVWREVTGRAGDYARGKVYEILIFASAAFITYHLIGLRYATLLAVMTGLSVLIPYIGAAAATLPIALVAYFQWGLGSEMATAVGAYLVLQAIDGNILSPVLFSEVVKLHPNAIIVAVLVFGGLWGFWGVFFAIPLATITNAVIRAWQDSVTSADTHESLQASDMQG